MRGGFAVGVDVGGTKIAGVLVDDEGVVRKRRRMLTLADEGREAVLGRVGLMVRKLTRREDLRVGVSFPGHISGDGLLRECPNLPGLEGQPLRQLLHRHVKHPLVVENDANCFALAEQRAGAAEGKRHVVGLVVGTGIGAGVVIDGGLYRGFSNGAGEVGHIPYLDGDIESFAAGPGIVRRYYRHGGTRESAERVFEKRSLTARKTVEETVEALGWLCLILVKAYDPEVVVLGGGVSNAPVIKGINEYLRGHGVASCKVVRNALGDSSGCLGAALLALGGRRKGF
ncbi:ROK family protein [Candidatus Woesearchaeota archaeon]|nr:ROK family protein [Candidatus Woesearchaeota archaeon]